jgi:predicted neutral ceramidase superfamily lipid hydrolase
MDGKPITAVVEKVDGQKTLLLGSDENGPCETVNAKADEVSDRFEEVKVFTTDTHEDIKDLANTEEIDEDRLSSVIQEASETLSPASAGLTSSRCRDINLLNRDYYSITHSINIITRLFPLSIIILYVSLMVWLAFA